MLPIPSVLLVLLLASLPSAGDRTGKSIPRGMGGGISRIPAFTWTVAAWNAGDVITTQATSRSVLHTRILSDGKLVQEFDQTEDRGADKVITILAADPRGPTRLRVEYRRMRFIQSGMEAGAGGAPEAAVNPLAKRTFLLERDGATFHVLDDAGKPVEQSLAQLVLEEEAVHGGELRRAGDLFARELAGKMITPGDEVEVSRDVARAFVDGREGLDAVSMKVVLMPEITSEGGFVAAFETHLSIDDTGSGGGTPTRIQLTGLVRIDVATGHYLSCELAGQLSLGQATADAARAVEVVGSGPWKITERVSWSRAP
jgi:hypothetical protein